MPPGRRSSSSRSSSSRRSSSRRSSSSRSSRSSRSRSSYSSSRRYRTRSSYIPRRTRSNQPLNVPDFILASQLFIQCKNHDYVYYKQAWKDEKTGTVYQRGYYDENGKFYNGDDLVFRKPDGSYEAHYVCDFCGTEFESNWKEGFCPTCRNCGAQMRKEMVFIDDIIDINSSTGGYDVPQRDYSGVTKSIVRRSLIRFLLPLIMGPIMVTLLLMFQSGKLMTILMDMKDDSGTGYSTDTTATGPQEELNLQIYGTDIYLDEVGDRIYRICEESDAYEKHITWDYGAQSYYDIESDCYLWYNTDVSPNLWQYWYEDIAGSNYYGWMECEGDIWYIEVSDTQWDEYTGDTSGLWHIENPFDQGITDEDGN